MKQGYYTLLILFSFCLVSYKAIGQVSSFTAAQSSGTYTAITGGTVLLNGSSASMDDVVSTVNIPSFSFLCTSYTTIYVSTNGYITFGTAPATNNYTPISNAAAYAGAVSAFGNNLDKATAGTPEIRYEDRTATSEFVIQWQDMRRNGVGGTERISFQIRLNYSTSVITTVYGGTITAGATTPTVQVGLRGASNADFNNRTTAAIWSATTAGGANNSACTYSSTGPIVPASGQTYTFTPPAMTFTSCTVVQGLTTTVSKCDYDQEIIKLQVVVAGASTPMSVTQILLTMAGTAPTSDVSKIHVYYTGTLNAFSTTSEFVSGGTSPAAGTITLTGSRALQCGTNYFWIAYDINPAATVTNTVDALLVAANSVTVGGITRTPTANNPGGSRSIVACPTYSGTTGGNLKLWVKSDVGVTGSPVTSWADQSTAAVSGNLIGQLSTKRPAIVANAVNYQPYIVFDGVDDMLRSANKFVGTNMFNATDNTILMVKRYYGGGVDFKWESWAGSGPHRIGMETNGSITQRFDFDDDLTTGNNSNSTTNILNKDVIVAGVTDATSNTVRFNGVNDATKAHALTFAPGATTFALFIGQNDTVSFPIAAAVKIGEIMVYNKKLSTSEMKRAESYLALKYGITLGNNKGSGSAVSYLESDGTSIWSNNGYHNDVIGIGRDNAAGNSGLNKLKSTSVASLNGSTDILTITNGTTPWTGASFGADKSFLIVGNNAASVSETAAVGGADLPAGIEARMDRVWKAQETGTVGTVTLTFNMTTVLGVANVAGANDLSKVRLLVDADGIMAGGATLIAPTAFDNTADTVVFQTDFAAGTGFFFSIGSVDLSSAPLPIALLNFNADVCEQDVCLDWATATETNNDYFTVEKTKDGVKYEFVAKVNGGGNSTSYLAYTAIDKNPYSGISYYRLKQTDYNGAYKYSNIQMVNFSPNIDFAFNLYPNPSTGEDINVAINAGKGKEVLVVVYDVTGRETYSKVLITEEAGKNVFAIDPSGKLAAGIYLITATSDDHVNTKKLIVK